MEISAQTEITTAEDPKRSENELTVKDQMESMLDSAYQFRGQALLHHQRKRSCVCVGSFDA